LKLWCGLFIFHALIGSAQSLTKQEIMALSEAKLPEAMGNLQQFLRLRNNGNHPEEVEQNRAWCDSVFTSLKFKTTTLPTKGAPLLYAEKIMDPWSKKCPVLFADRWPTRGQQRLGATRSF
jgi:hypothetical protein